MLYIISRNRSPRQRRLCCCLSCAV